VPDQQRVYIGIRCAKDAQNAKAILTEFKEGK